MKSTFRITLVDLSGEMLDVSRRRNPECTHIQGDMRTFSMGRQFDAVFVHDAISHMTTKDDLRMAIGTAYQHCKVGGAALFCPDHTLESLKESAATGGKDEGDKGLRYLEWTIPDAANRSMFIGGRRTMPAIQWDGTIIVAVSPNQMVVSLGPDGTRKAQLAIPDMMAPNASPSIDARGRIYISLRYGFACLSPDLSTEVWSRLVADGSTGIAFASSPSLGADAVYVTSQDGNYGGELYAIPLSQ